MSERKSSELDVARIARDGLHVDGRIDVSRLERLSGLLFDDSGVIEYAVDGAATARGHRGLTIRLRGTLQLPCQRCLERLPFALETARQIVLMDDAKAFDPEEDEDDDTDIIPTAEAPELEDLIEQEVVLSLPMAPRHSPGQCPGGDMAAEPTKEASPFAALAKLKQH